MNKFIKICLFIIAFIVCCSFTSKQVYADSYPISSALEVAEIKDDGTFKTIKSYDSFSKDNFAKAQAKMKENENYVIRSSKSKSPTKIIDMNSGIVYTYPARVNKATLTVYSDLTAKLAGTGASTYTNSYKPLQYISNKYIDEDKGYSRGWVKISCHGFVGYTDLEAVDFVPTKYIKKGIPITLGGNQTIFEKPYNSETPYKVICKANTYKAVRNGNYTDLVLTTYYGHSSDTNGGVGTSYSYRIGVAPSFMNLDTKYYSDDGINFYSDIELKNLVGTYYNYYQFVPARTKTNISASTFDAYVESKKKSGKLNGNGNLFKNNEAKYGCNAALIYSIAINESGWGTSGYAMNRNNLFGLNAFDSDPDQAFYFPSINDSIAFMMGDFLANYMDVHYNYYFSMSLGNKGGGFVTKYASDMYWAEKAAEHYYDLDKFANGYNGNLSDYNSYNIALVNTYDVEIKKEAKSGSSGLYRTANPSGYQKNLIVVTLGETNGFTKTQLSNPIDSSNKVVFPRSLEAGTKAEYNFERSVGYIPTSALISLNSGNNQKSQEEEQKPKEPIPSKMEPMVSVDQFDLDGNVITLKGVGVITYSHFDDLSKIKHEFVVKNLETGNEATYILSSEEYPGFSLNDGYNYKYVGFSGTVNLNELIDGSFKLMIRITNGEYTKEKEIRNSNAKYLNLSSKIGNTMYRISYNARSSYRLELEIIETPLDYSLINLVKNRPSLFSYDNFTIDDNLDLHIDGQAFIFYTNYDNADDTTYKIYLIKDAEKYKEINAQHKTCSLDFTKEINSNYNLTNICFEANENISDLETGEYKLIMEINKKDGEKTYIDYIEMTNLGNSVMPNVTKDLTKYEVIKQAIRDRMILKVEAQNEE